MKHERFYLGSTTQPLSKESLLALLEEFLVERLWTTYSAKTASQEVAPRIPAAATDRLTRFVRLPEVLRVSGLSRATIYARIAKGTFPRQISLGENTVAWLESDIIDWMHARVNATLSRS